MKEQQNPEQKPSEVEISHLPDEEFKEIVIRIPTKFGRKIEEHREL